MSAGWLANKSREEKMDHYAKSIGKWASDHPEKRSERSVKAMSSPDRRALQKVIGRRVFYDKQTQLKAVTARMKNPRMKAGKEHHSCKMWCLRDPFGTVFTFPNLRDFVMTHHNLFDSEDVKWGKNGRNWWCRAMSLGKLNPETIKPLATWKGWTWQSIYERRFNDGNDLLNRL